MNKTFYQTTHQTQPSIRHSMIAWGIILLLITSFSQAAEKEAAEKEAAVAEIEEAPT